MKVEQENIIEIKENNSFLFKRKQYWKKAGFFLLLKNLCGVSAGFAFSFFFPVLSVVQLQFALLVNGRLCAFFFSILYRIYINAKGLS